LTTRVSAMCRRHDLSNRQRSKALMMMMLDLSLMG
jgi:hypothetical protein